MNSVMKFESLDYDLRHDSVVKLKNNLAYQAVCEELMQSEQGLITRLTTEHFGPDRVSELLALQTELYAVSRTLANFRQVELLGEKENKPQNESE